jgi:hypothetical protein
MSTVRSQIQDKVNGWINHIHNLDRELRTLERNSKEWEYAKESLAEYKGQLYAVRFIDGMLGFGFDTNWAGKLPPHRSG